MSTLISISARNVIRDDLPIGAAICRDNDAFRRSAKACDKVVFFIVDVVMDGDANDEYAREPSRQALESRREDVLAWLRLRDMRLELLGMLRAPACAY